MRLSVVITYHNRPNQFRLSLKSILEQCDPDLELIVVDDASDEGLEARKVLNELGVEATLVEVTKEEKYWINPSVPYNMGFAEVTGDIVVIQNAESVHVGPVLHDMRSRVGSGNYVVAPCYSSTKAEYERMAQISIGNVSGQVKSIVEPFNQDQWYHHPSVFPKWYHFCAGITTKNLQRLGGFNEAYALGYCFEDNDFLLRIRKKLRVSIDSTTGGLYVVHQWHPKNTGLVGGCPLWERNRIIYAKMEEALR